MTALIALVALGIERVLGYPAPLFRAIGHPVTWIGALIGALESRWNGGARRRLKGVAMLALVLTATVLPVLALTWVARFLPFGFLLEALAASSLLAQKELGRAVAAVAAGLARSLDAGRAAVAHVVGRDTAALDESGVAKAAVETLAESTSDGVMAPLFWLLVGGLPAMALYKAINTADSMVGHKNTRYAEFGWASARLDDIANLVPARATAALVVAAARLTSGADAHAAWTAARRDARKHASPNSGWPEAAFAGALGLALGGPRAYQGEVHDLPQFGTGRAMLNTSDITRALALYRRILDVALAAVLIGLALTLRIT